MDVGYMDIDVDETDRRAVRESGKFGASAVERDHELPTELLEEIFLAAWLSIPLFDSTDRWFLFSKLSLVNHRFRALALWVATRHVRVLSQSSTDIAAYRSIGQQYLALQQVPRRIPCPQADEESLLKGVFQHSTVHLDVTFALHTTWNAPDLWLKDDIWPGRPDDDPEIRVRYDAMASSFGDYHYPEPEKREEVYRSWLARRQRDRLSGWFATLLAAVPDCAALVLDSHPDEPFGITAYAGLLEAFWWWTSLAAVHFRVVPGYADWAEEMGGMHRGPLPPLLALAAVRRVRLDARPGCTCRRPGVADASTVTARVHAEECTMRRMLEPFPGLRSGDDVVIPSGIEVRMRDTSEQSLELVGLAGGPSDGVADKEVVPRVLPGLNILGTDTLWELIDPVSSFS
ncbi:hypothetical protein TRAPUB_6563 [Trametes pubescens]|uniref:Uncharacterized protein n=1 Tax=Trametes pubescens TaxID=154538 RepID=A0A1M2V5P4_TRAPU|nr:hypothetical protein TRAPUB_6563 [Trametes pubescens]